MVEELVRLAEASTIWVLDLLIITKDDDGSVEAMEIDDLGGADEIRRLEGQIAEILAADDVEMLAAAIEPGTVAAVLVWENIWAAPFGSAARRAGGQLVATGRIPIQALAASWKPNWRPRPLKEGTDMPLGPGRVGRVGVVGSPAMRTAAVVGTANVVSNGVDRRQDRREDRRDDRGDRRDRR